MSRTLLVIGLIAVIAMPAAAREKGKKGKKARKGKVVRVERTRLDGSGMVRMCGQVQPDGTAYCWGKAPVEGQVVTVFDENGRRANLVIRTVTPQVDACGNAISWILSTSVQGDISQLSYLHAALLDWEGEARTRTVQNAQLQGLRLGESVWAGFDDDGDDNADLIVTYMNCDPSGNPTQTYPYGAFCVGYYKREGSSYAMLRTDVVKQC